MGGIVKGATDALGLTSSDDEKYMKKAAGMSAKQLAMLQAIDLPDYEKMKLALENPELVGLLEAEQLDPSAMEDVEVDSNLQEAQRVALEELQERGAIGLTPEDRARLNQIQRESQADNQAAQKQILQGMAERGQLDSGAQLIAQLQSAGQSNQDAALAGERLAAEAAAARRNALQQSGQMAGQMAQQQFGQEAQKSQAKDAINQFNLQQRSQTQAANLAARQGQENQRAALSNQQQMYNKGLEQQRFQDELAKAGAAGNAMNNMANMYSQQAANVSAGNQATIGGLASVGSAFVASDKNLKENIREPRENEVINKLEKMLDELKAYKYNYKDEMGLPEDERIGPMAQDLEKSELGQEFVEEDMNGNKMVDYGKMAGTQLAAIADLHRRIKELEGEE